MRSTVRKFDDFIRLSNGVFEFSQDPNCLLRLQVTVALRVIQLPGVKIQTGDPVLLIHLWNERLPPFSAQGADLGWARRFLRLFNHSLCLVAYHIRQNPGFDSIRAVGGETILLTAGLRQAGRRVIQDMGFSVTPYHSRLGRFGEFWENFYSWLIIWSFNPQGLPHRTLLSLSRSEMWISREAFLKRYDQPA